MFFVKSSRCSSEEVLCHYIDKEFPIEKVFLITIIIILPYDIILLLRLSPSFSLYLPSFSLLPFSYYISSLLSIYLTLLLFSLSHYCLSVLLYIYIRVSMSPILSLAVTPHFGKKQHVHVIHIL